MARVKRGKTHLRKRKKLLQRVKGYQYGRKSKLKLAKTAVLKAGVYARRDRRAKKRSRRRNWAININAAVRPLDLSYSKFIHLLHSKNIRLDRKVLVAIAERYPNTMKQIVNEVKK